MQKSIKKYGHGELKLVRDDLSKKDSKILNDYIIFCKGTAGDFKVGIVERQLLMIRDVSQVSYASWDLTKLREFLAILNKSELAEATKNDIKKHFKRFLREQYEDWSLRFKDLKDIKCGKDINQERVNSKTILQKGELERLIRGAESLKLKALIILLYESGARPSEVLSAKWKDLDLEKSDIKLTSTKNKTVRVNPLKESIIHLRRYKEEYPFPNVASNDFLFPSLTNRQEHLNVSYLGYLFRNLTKRVLKRQLFPYILRHSRATELQKSLTPKIYEKFMDHSIEMATRYSHLNKDDVREQLLERVYHIEEITEGENKKIIALSEIASLLVDVMQLYPLKRLPQDKEKEMDKIYNKIGELQNQIK